MAVTTLRRSGEVAIDFAFRGGRLQDVDPYGRTYPFEWVAPLCGAARPALTRILLAKNRNACYTYSYEQNLTSLAPGGGEQRRCVRRLACNREASRERAEIFYFNRP